MDVDGTLTDGKIYMGPGGEVTKAFNIKDGCGIRELLKPAKITPVILTARKSVILENRCKELNISSLYQGVSDKREKLFGLLSENGQNFENVAYIGDDINDLPCMREVKAGGGVVGCPGDAVPEVKKISDFISAFDGGNGAVRDFIEWIIA